MSLVSVCCIVIKSWELGMKKSLFVGAAVLLCSFGLHSSVSAQETTVSFCKPGYTTEQTPTELAICNDPSGRTELYISSALALMNDENVSSSDRKRFLKEQDNWYDFLSSLCKSSDLSCIEASAKKRLQTVQGRVLAAVANSTSTGKKMPILMPKLASIRCRIAQANPIFPTCLI